jgi:hypothetical protein
MVSWSLNYRWLGLSLVGFVTGLLYAVQEVLEAEVRAIYGRVYIVALVVRGEQSGYMG